MTLESRLPLVASAGGLNAKASASTIGSVFQFLILGVYCGAPASVLLVMTFARDRSRARLDPDLPVRVGIAKCEMVAFDALNDARADIFGIDDARHQLFVRIAQQQIGARHRSSRLGLKRIDDLINRSARIGLDTRFGVVAVQRKRLAVIDQFDFGIATRAPDPQLVGPVELELPGAGELDLLQLGRDDLDVTVKDRRNRFLRGHIVRQRLQDLGSVLRLRGLACRCDEDGYRCGRHRSSG
jgi:hypothetical protein